MSRVRGDNKFVNESRHDHTVTDASPVKRCKGENADYTKAGTLSSWLFLKYDMSYKTYRNKSKARREALRAEYTEDTGRLVLPRRVWDEEDET